MRLLDNIIDCIGIMNYTRGKSEAQCKTTVTQLQLTKIYDNPALSHRFVVYCITARTGLLRNVATLVVVQEVS